VSASPQNGDDTAARIGERLAALRAGRGLRVVELARRAGVSPSLVSQIERGQSRPSVTTLVALAEGVGAPIDALFRERAELGEPGAAADSGAHADSGAPGDGAAPADPAAPADRSAPAAEPPPGAGDERFVVRRGERATIEIEGGVRWERLTPTTLEHADVIELVYAPGAQSHAQPYRHPEGIEMVLVLSGTLIVEVDGEAYELHEGDSMQFPSSAEHRYVNPTDEEARGVGARVYTGRPA
jgi:transcriptional regulator with XRE-family HTH domain